MNEQSTLWPRVRAEKLGGHIHCNVFSSPVPNQTFGKNGTLIFDEREWPMARERLERFANEVFYKEETK